MERGGVKNRELQGCKRRILIGPDLEQQRRFDNPALLPARYHTAEA